MKKTLKKIVFTILKNDFSWNFLNKFFKSNNYLHGLRKASLIENKNTLSKKLFPNLVVEEGLFKGMIYPGFDSVGSAFFPKLLGTYERELLPFFEDIKNNNYNEILDIGCAEGYYAVGLALNYPKAKIYAFDINPIALELCKKMATINNVLNNLNLLSECSSDYLLQFPFSESSLIVCDCEGFEKELFNNSNVNKFLNCDIIIEAHDFIDNTISIYLKNLFKNTHHVSTIKSIDDNEKPDKYFVKKLSKYSFNTRKKILAEDRPDIMEWVICKSLKNQ